MAVSDIAFVQLFWDLMNRRTGELGRVDFIPQKPDFDLEAEEEQPLPRSTPEAQGVESSFIEGLVRELYRTPHVNPHALTIVRHGQIIYEGSYDPYVTGVWHVTYSMCKSFTGMAIGLLVDEGKLHLEDHVLDILKPSRSYLGSILMQRKFYELTIRDLLVMSSGTAFNEVGAISGNDWTREYFSARSKFEPGTKFEYNSMNSYILSAVVSELTGKTMFEYLKEKLFVPMGITRVFWESSPENVTKAGWGMFITQEDAAKLGMLYLNKGIWNGQQLISKEWVEEATKPQIQTGREDNPEYGYHVWMNNRPGSFTYNGMLGQDVFVYPDLDMIAVINAGNEEVFQNGTMTKVIRKYFSLDYAPSDTPLPENPAAYAKLQFLKKRMENPAPQAGIITGGGWGRRHAGGPARETFFERQSGRTYEMHSKGIGLFTLIMQVVHNNFTHGISSLTFEKKNGILYLIFREGTDTHRIPVGFGKSRHTAVRVNGEEYLVGTQGRFGTDEDGHPVLSLRIAFIEEATERLLKIVFLNDEEIQLFWDETPGNEIIAHILEMITTGSGNTNVVINGLMNQVSPGLIRDAMRSTVQPMVHAKLVTEGSGSEEGSK